MNDCTCTLLPLLLNFWCCWLDKRKCIDRKISATTFSETLHEVALPGVCERWCMLTGLIINVCCCREITYYCVKKGVNFTTNLEKPETDLTADMISRSVCL